MYGVFNGIIRVRIHFIRSLGATWIISIICVFGLKWGVVLGGLEGISYGCACFMWSVSFRGHGGLGSWLCSVFVVANFFGLFRVLVSAWHFWHGMKQKERCFGR